MEATVLASALSGAPSTVHALIKRRSLRAAAVYVYDATRAVGTLVPPGRAGFGRGMAVHIVISMLCGEALARTLPRDHPAEWGATAGLVIGVVNVGVIGRSFPAIRAPAAGAPDCGQRDVRDGVRGDARSTRSPVSRISPAG